MSLAHLIVIVCLMGAACPAPTTPSPGTHSEIERDSQSNKGLPQIKATPESRRNESAATTLGVELVSEFPEEAKCQTAWQKFLVDFEVHYASDVEAEKRRNIFCDNWKRIQEHNAQYEVGKVSHKKSINQWSDLTFDEWKNSQSPVLAPEFATAKPTTESPELAQARIRCQAAWEQFLIDFGSKYDDDTEAEKRRNIFCDNWKRIQEHNALYEAGKVSHKKSINQWADLTFEEWKNKQSPVLAPEFATAKPTTEPPELDQARIRCQAAWEHFLIDFGSKYDNDAEVEKRRSIFCKNWERIQEHNAQYELGKMSHKKSINQWADLTFDEWKNSQSPVLAHEFATAKPTTETPEPAQARIRCQAAWEQFLIDFGSKYDNDAEAEKRRNIFCNNWQRIQEHNALYEAGKVSHKKGINQWSDLTFEEWKKTQESAFPPNTELPGSKSEASVVDQKRIKCQADWETFLIEYDRKYESVDEAEKRRIIFCENWQRIQEHNALYELEKDSYQKRINQWSDLTFEELKNESPYTFPPNMEGQQYGVPANIEEPEV